MRLRLRFVEGLLETSCLDVLIFGASVPSDSTSPSSLSNSCVVCFLLQSSSGLSKNRGGNICSTFSLLLAIYGGLRRSKKHSELYS